MHYGKCASGEWNSVRVCLEQSTQIGAMASQEILFQGSVLGAFSVSVELDHAWFLHQKYICRYLLISR